MPQVYEITELGRKIENETQNNNQVKKDLNNNRVAMEAEQSGWRCGPEEVSLQCGQIKRKIKIKGDVFNLKKLLRNVACKKQGGLREQK